jgi:hypothetical protein
MENLRQDLGTLLFEGGEGIGQGGASNPNVFIRSDYDAKKENIQILTSMSRTPGVACRLR